ncbi:hypothetical protein M0R45_020090 [Rubus argutus]|uniref:Uncharacterized protein n=1 Tax=Rubus argutus TaxID=59490 RepID=A0AAW1X916_RUBAR
MESITYSQSPEVGVSLCSIAQLTPQNHLEPPLLEAQTTPQARASIKATAAPSISTQARAQLFFRPLSPARISASDAVVSPTTSSLAFLHCREPRSGLPYHHYTK